MYKSMRLYFVGLVFLAILILAAALFGADPLPTEQIDTEFVALLTTVDEMAYKATLWNAQCGETPKTESCEKQKATMAAEYGKFILRALQYQSKGDGCRAELRQAVVAHYIHVASFNSFCPGETSRRCQELTALLEAEQLTLRHQFEVCSGQKPTDPEPKSTSKVL